MNKLAEGAHSSRPPLASLRNAQQGTAAGLIGAAPQLAPHFLLSSQQSHFAIWPSRFGGSFIPPHCYCCHSQATNWQPLTTRPYKETFSRVESKAQKAALQLFLIPKQF
jgi:hypothetical protein